MSTNILLALMFSILNMLDGYILIETDSRFYFQLHITHAHGINVELDFEIWSYKITAFNGET